MVDSGDLVAEEVLSVDELALRLDETAFGHEHARERRRRVRADPAAAASHPADERFRLLGVSPRQQASLLFERDEREGGSGQRSERSGDAPLRGAARRAARHPRLRPASPRSRGLARSQRATRRARRRPPPRRSPLPAGPPRRRRRSRRRQRRLEPCRFRPPRRELKRSGHSRRARSAICSSRRCSIVPWPRIRAAVAPAIASSGWPTSSSLGERAGSSAGAFAPGRCGSAVGGSRRGSRQRELWSPAESACSTALTGSPRARNQRAARRWISSAAPGSIAAS